MPIQYFIGKLIGVKMYDATTPCYWWWVYWNLKLCALSTQGQNSIPACSSAHQTVTQAQTLHYTAKYSAKYKHDILLLWDSENIDRCKSSVPLYLALAHACCPCMLLLFTSLDIHTPALSCARTKYQMNINNHTHTCRVKISIISASIGEELHH